MDPRSWLFVGQLEHYVEDVTKLVAALGFAPAHRARLVNASLGSSNFAKVHPHAVSNATRYAVATAAALRAFRTDEATRTIVCHLLHVEHACINPLLPIERRYALPDECKVVSVSPAPDAVGRRLEKSAVGSIMIEGRPRKLKVHEQGMQSPSPTQSQQLCAVVISAAPHAHLLPRVVSSVLSSTLLPEQLIISLSGVGDTVCVRANASVLPLMAAAPTVQLRLLCTARMRSSGQNRNLGAAACAASSASANEDAFISFIDSDDLLLPTRLATITGLMREHRADLGLHSYVGAVGCCHSPQRIITPEAAAKLYAAMPRCTRLGFHTDCPHESAALTCRVRDSCSTSRCAHTSSCIHFLPGSLTRVHYAHSTARASVFKILQQREAAAYGKVEDSWFARDMAALGLRIVVTDEALTFYNRTSGHIQPPGLLAKKASAANAGTGRVSSEPAPVASAHEPPPESLLQTELDEAIAKGSWDNTTLRWVPFQQATSIIGGSGTLSPLQVLTNRSIVLLGDSTVRDMLSHLTGAPAAEPWRPNPVWHVEALGCDERVGSGCTDCWACCQPSCRSSDAARGGRRSFIPFSKRVAAATYVHRGWQDFVHTQGHTRTRIAFSWKPEAFSRADAAAFSTRFCAAPPSLLYIGKGLHDACRDNATTIDDVAAHAAARFRQLAHLLRCLPPSTLVVLRTPYFVSSKMGSSNRVCHYPSEEPTRVAAVRDVLRRMHAEQAFGTRALLLDAYAFTHAADENGSPALRTLDGHHYPPAVRSLEGALLSYALQAHEQSGSGGRIGVGAG